MSKDQITNEKKNVETVYNSYDKSIIEELYDQIQTYDFKEAADLLIYCMGYLDLLADYKKISEIFKMIYELL